MHPDLLKADYAAEVARSCRGSSLLSKEDVLFSVYDVDQLERQLLSVANAFPTHWKHSVAVKTNPLTKVLDEITGAAFGLEAASFQELHHAAGVDAPFLVWDSPVKTPDELQRAATIKKPFYINANSLVEFERLLAHELVGKENVQLGLRINPQMDTSSMASMSVSGSRSKFGEPIANAAHIVKTFRENGIKAGIHIHSSSQNLMIDESVEAVKRVYDLALSIGWENIAYVDIGGGFPVSYGFEDVPDMISYARLLHGACPVLFDGSIPVITEFGRYYHANASWTISQIHEVKHFEHGQVIIQHAGADLFLRESYEPGRWKHRFALTNDTGHLKTNEPMHTTDIAGPLCFGGDYLAKAIALPKTEEGDHLIIMDTGANAHGLWSRHCSRPFPTVIGKKGDNLFVIRKRESTDEALKLWS